MYCYHQIKYFTNKIHLILSRKYCHTKPTGETESGFGIGLPECTA